LLLALLPLAVVAACALHADSTGTTLVRPRFSTCVEPPHPGATGFRHGTPMGAPRYRAYDLIALSTDETQILSGKLAYSSLDFDLGDEDVQLYLCKAGAWESLSGVSTDRHGRWSYELSGDARLPPGLHDIFAFVPGNGGGVHELVYVAAPGESIIVVDIDGTLTESENAIVNTVLFGDDIAHRPNAPQALRATHHTIVYLSARGDQYTEVTRHWLSAHGFPDGPIVLAHQGFVKPGPAQQQFKLDALHALRVPIAAGVGNRITDIIAYARAGLRPEQILVFLPEYQDEVRDQLVARRAIGFHDYRSLPALVR
jgi:LNS2-like protein (lipin/Ned1/Smp2)